VAAASPGFAERVGAAAFLSVVFFLQLWAAFHLSALAAFDQYNLFFDADANQYVSAVANGWSFNREIHPGFALFINVPLRAVDALASALGMIPAGAIRNVFAIVLSPLCGLLGGVLLWRACIRAGLSGVARIGALVLLQGSFSQVVFTAIPESYAVSGMLYCLLLWAAAHAAARPADMQRTAVRAGWLLLCVVMTGVTVSNGILCIGVWLGLRAGVSPRRRWVLEALIGACVLAISIVALRIIDRWIYTLPNVVISRTVEAIRDHRLTSSFVPRSVTGRVVGLPAYALASILAPPMERRRGHPARTGDDRYPFRFSFIDSAITGPRLLGSWAVLICGLVAGVRRFGGSPLVRATAVVLAFNFVLHSVWGQEVFLYSQHWLAFLTFAIAAGVDRTHPIGGPLLLALGIIVALHSVGCFTEILATLHSETGTPFVVLGR
jgi:hypothetical protein